MSTRDLNVFNDLKKLENAGINSIKLEGRMKSEDYVGTIVNRYRNLLDNNEGSFKDDLNIIFNRKFTNAYFLNQKPGNVMGRKRSGHLGFYIGKITEILHEEEIITKNLKYSKKIRKVGEINLIKMRNIIRIIRIIEIIRVNRRKIIKSMKTANYLEINM